MNESEFLAVLEVMDGYWSQPRSEEVTMAWGKDLASWSAPEAIEVLEYLHELPGNDYRPVWARFTEVARLLRRQPERQPALPPARCSCDEGFRWVEGRTDAVIPCADCNPWLHDRWSKGAFTPRRTAPANERTPHELAAGLDAIADLRDEMSERRR